MEQVFYSLPGFRWQDALDILLNAYILFRLYVLFRGTNVFRVLLVVCLLWVLHRSAGSMGLVITNWAMQGVITAATFIIIIVFRNEISAVIQTRDFKSFFWGIPRHQRNTPLDIIIDSAADLAEKKIGALIILPLKQGVDNIVKDGVLLQANLSREMLTSIFWPDNPLHDGAAVIQGDRITRAGAILPLTSRRDLASAYGTRHRAALGLTESCDAVVLVVSEERGQISLVKDNEIHPIRRTTDAKQALKAMLTRHAGNEAEARGLRRQARELAVAATLCLLFTSGLWYYFSRGMETLATHEIPIEYTNPDPRLKLTKASVSGVKLLISGAKPLINALKPEQVRVKLDLADASTGINTLAVTRENILLPPGIRLKSIDPANVEITLDALTEKRLPVQPDWTGKLPEGYIMKGARAIPPELTVMGGELALKNLATVFTEKIDLSRLKDSGVVSVGLKLNSPGLKLKDRESIQVQYFVSPKTEQN
ncbi:MAG: DNA integrity scanning protein DisA nucleotide-binding domain protein [Desulfobacter sp.]|nr:MAG: DNA integrity scanning protein DisA nucleotide-binding domain protein [Desulfobacter sp.]